MPFLLDTNAWIQYLKDVASPIGNQLRLLSPADVKLCAIVKAELLHGAQKYGNREQRLAILDELFAPYESLAFDDEAAKLYGDIRHQLEIAGRVIGPYDLQIAAICLVHDLTLVTSDPDFERISQLKQVNWLMHH